VRDAWERQDPVHATPVLTDLAKAAMAQEIMGCRDVLAGLATREGRYRSAAMLVIWGKAPRPGPRRAADNFDDAAASGGRVNTSGGRMPWQKMASGMSGRALQTQDLSRAWRRPAGSWHLDHQARLFRGDARSRHGNRPDRLRHR
jgi:hypothetical protein